MKENRLIQIEKDLSTVPMETLIFKKHSPVQKDSYIFSDQFRICYEGRGIAEAFSVLPGIEIHLCKYAATRISGTHPPMTSVLQINHCRAGRMGWQMEDGNTLCLGPGDLSLHKMDVCARSEISYPLGFYEGLSVFIDLDILNENPPEALKDAGISGSLLDERLCGQKRFFAMPANPKIEHIFSDLYDLPRQMLLPYFKLKAQELALFLSMLHPEQEKQLTPSLSQQVMIIQTIHEQLTSHLEQRFTIESLSKQYLINASSLKEVFKSVYGLPIATYMKEYRMKQAALRLRESSDSIAQIAASIGYESQSKFTKAFMESYQLLPSSYRRLYRNRN